MTNLATTPPYTCSLCWFANKGAYLEDNTVIAMLLHFYRSKIERLFSDGQFFTLIVVMEDGVFG